MQLVEEEKLRGTPAQERERLLQQVKDDNAEISTMERQITEMTERVSRTRCAYINLLKKSGRISELGLGLPYMTSAEKGERDQVMQQICGQ